MNYALDKTTGIYNMGWAIGPSEPQVWHPGESFPEEILEHIAAGGCIAAWNASFERLIWWYVLSPDFGIPEPELEQFHCTAARARAHGIPGKLDDATRCMGLPIQKHPEGTRLIREYSANNVHWDDIPDEDRALWDKYVLSDVETERMVGSLCRELTDDEWEEYAINELNNDRGVPVDVEFAKHALCYADEVRSEVDGKIAKLTDFRVANSRKRKTRDEWLLPQLNAEQIELITRAPEKVDEKTGKVTPAKYSFDQEHRDNLAKHPDLPPKIEEWLKLLDEAGGATISKYEAMTYKQTDGAVCGSFMWNGAGKTGRFSSLGIQWQNLRRDSLEHPEDVIEDVIAGYEIEDVTDTLGRAVRSAIYRPEGLTWSDWSSIEGRVAPWLEGTKVGEVKLNVYRSGQDPYIMAAGGIYRCRYDDVTKEQRQTGKVAELALGFLGGVGALRSMGKNYGVYFTEEQAEEIRDGWRATNPWAKKLGGEIDLAAEHALLNPGEWFKAGRVSLGFDGEDWLWMRLPSGRLLAYFKPERRVVQTPWGEDRIAVTCIHGATKPKRGQKWPRRAMHPGIWIENATQGAAACLLREALVKCHYIGLDTRMSVHDEIIVDGYHKKLLRDIMLDAPAWSAGLPLEAEAGSGMRYGK